MHELIQKKVFPLVIYPINTFFRDICFLIEDKYIGTKEYVSASELYSFLNKNNVNTIVINSLVSYHSVSKVLDYVLYLKEKKEITIITMVHDYFIICPNYNLTLNNKSYCGLNCKYNKCNLRYPFTFTKVDINFWRKTWKEFLLQSDEVRVFDNSAVALLESVYPELKSISVKPHSLEYIKYTPIKTFFSDSLRIGVVGVISRVKGKKIVIDLAKILSLKKEKLYIVGDCKVFRKNIIHTGLYKQGELGERLIKNKINVVLFPSIWPETFSYVISELIALDIPIVCFDLGAQANKVKAYYKGRICKEINAESAYKELSHCFDNFVKIKEDTK